MSDVILYKEDIDRLNSVLQAVVSETKVISVLLVNKDTRLLASQGTLAMFDKSALGALIVGSFASTQGIATLIGEKEFSTMSHSGKTRNLLISLVDDNTIIASIFDKSTPIAAVTVSVERHVEELKKVLRDIVHNMDSLFQAPASMPSLSMSQEDVEQGIDSFFDGQASDKLTEEQVPVQPPHPPQYAEAHAGYQEARDIHAMHGEIPPPPDTQMLTDSDMPEDVEGRAGGPVAAAAGQSYRAASELDKSLSRNASPSSQQKGPLPPPSPTEYLYVTSLHYLKNKARQGSGLTKHKHDKNLLSRFFNKPKHGS
jgi:predicted regulator of Ras-like GTPase activity (Roadblock/LC7/MglB family)